MASDDDMNEILLRVPAELTVKCKGLALDMGGTVLKLAFRTKEDVDNALKNGDFGFIRLISTERAKLTQALGYVRQRCHVTAVDDDEGQPTSVHTTGVGCTEFGKIICQTLNIRMINVMEMDCFIKAFTYLADRLPRSELLEPFLVDVLAEPVAYADNLLMTYATFQTMNLTKAFNFELPLRNDENILKNTGRHEATATDSPSTQPLSKAEPDMYPCLMVMCGSGLGFMKIDRDGTFRLIDVSIRGGKGFTGLGLLLTNSESFNEMIELAAEGDYSSVHQYTDEVCIDQSNIPDDEDSLYKTVLTDEKVRPEIIFGFGKAATGSKNFRREDVAAAWLHWYVVDMVQSLTLTSRNLDIKRVFFCGGFCQNELVRRYITQEMVTRNLYTFVMKQQSEPVTFDFIKPGQHLGTIGCMVYGL